MTGQARRLQSMWPWVAALTIIIGGIALLASSPSEDLLRAENLINAPLTVVYALLGLLIAVKRPGNRIAWILFLIGGSSVLNAAAELRIDGVPDPVTVWDALAVVWSNVGYFVALLIPLLLLLYIFPSGHFLSRRWSWAGWAAGVSVLTLLFVEAFPVELKYADGGWTINNPIGFHSIPGVASEGFFGLLFGILFIALTVGAPVAIVVRFRRSSEVVRSQLKLVVWALALVPLIFVTGSIAPQDLWINTAVFVGALAAVPIAITVAIVRHNLFDIDVVISRSVTFGVLAVFIGGVYVGIVVGIGELFGGAGSSSFGLSVVATAVVALGFQPVRVWVEGWANRLVYGKRATPYEVLARFSHRAAEESDEDVVGRIPRLIVDGTGAVEAVVWVSEGDGFRAVAVWPESDGVRRVDSDLFEVAGADVSLPVFHDGEILGGISLVAARGGSITPPERELVENLADGLGLTLRNGQLTAQLRRQVKDLQRSRDRVVSAADEARRSLEHDLDSGPLQQLVAVKVKLGPIRKLAEQAAATRTAQVLADIDAQTGDAIQAVRDFAAGVYPPLLEAEGLVAALTHELHKAAIPVELATQHVDRYPRDIESAVYFAVLEALQNTAKYANATHAVVRLSDTDGVLEFDVTDNGQGFDPATVTKGAGLNGITDRIDTIGGTTTITATPNHGTTITATIPIKEPTSSAMVPQ